MTQTPDEFDELLQRAYRYALALTHDRIGAEELLQEACLSVARRGGPWNVGYLMSAVRSRFIDRGRRAGVMRFGRIDDHEPPRAKPADPGLSDEVERALARLGPDQREMLFLSALEACSAGDIARMTGRPRGTVLSTLYRAKIKLREMLSGSGGKGISV